MMIRKIIFQKGQTFITMIFFVIIAITIISAEAIVLFTNTQAASAEEQGIDAYYAAESGTEEALLRLSRNPSYSGGTINTENSSTSISVSNGVIVSTGSYGRSTRKIQVETAYNNGVLKIVSWKEI